MKSFHLIYKDKNGDMQSEYKNFVAFSKAEDWLKSIGAIDWEIGIPDND